MLAPLSASPVQVSINGLSKSVPGGRVLFAGLNLSIRRGEFVAVMGESGVGKSTLLNLVAGLDTPDAGGISIGGEKLESLSETARTRLRRDAIGFVFQAFHVLPHLTLAQNVALPLVLQHTDTGEAETRAEAMLAKVGLRGRGPHYPRVLSGGELQRVAIARALIHNPALILADEPTGNLDPETANGILDLIAVEVRQSGAAAILITHSALAASIADRTLILTQAGLVERDAS